jgi:branched-chain amino acid transport system ATP-binding protein
MSEPILSISNLSKHFYGLKAVDSLSFNVLDGQIKAIIGPNGAGKTTLFNVISGMLPATFGSMSFLGRSIAGLKPYEVARLGISRTFQNIQLFENMSVLENAMVGTHLQTKTGFIRSAFMLPGIRKNENKARSIAKEMLSLVGLDIHAKMGAGSLSFGHRRKLEIARALATRPKLLMLDEPASGLNIKETEEFGELIKKIRSLGATILLVEHDMSLVMSISDEVLVIDHGSKVAEGEPHVIQKDPRVIEVYLGAEESSMEAVQ